ncbi:hypothetical protein [Roseobacter weihaiensis]|uniref:hypothetical protein n=1 Tax=Roseobacter weihaiensis TaxID=2763262 RepID=UPI001D09D0AA
MISCSMPNDSEATLEVAELAHQRGPQIRCITDRPTGSLTTFSNVVFYANATRKSVPTTATSTIAITKGIIAAVANRREKGLDLRRTLDARHKP